MIVLSAELVEMVKKSVNDPYRPEIPRIAEDVDTKAVLLMKECWAELPDDRPNFEAIKKRILVINKGRSGSPSIQVVFNTGSTFCRMCVEDHLC